MHNKVVVVYRNDEVARAAANELLEDGFSPDQIYISSDDDIRQVRKYDQIGENRLLPHLEGDLGNFYRSVIGVDGMLESAGLYTHALKDGHVIVSVETDSYEKAKEAAKTMNHFETLGIGDFSTTSDSISDERKNTDTYEVAGTGVLIFRNYHSQGNQMDMNNTQNSSSDFDNKVNQKAASARDSIENGAESTKEAMKSAAEKTKDTVMNATDATTNAMEKAVDKTSDVLKKAGDSVKEMFGKDDHAKDDHTTEAKNASGYCSYDEIGEEAFKNHWKISYFTSGGKYDDCQPAYQYGAQLAENEKKHLNRSWEEVEPSAHAAWELYNRDSEQSWEKNKEAIKFGWDYVMENHKPKNSFF